MLCIIKLRNGTKSMIIVLLLILYGMKNKTKKIFCFNLDFMKCTRLKFENVTNKKKCRTLCVINQPYLIS